MCKTHKTAGDCLADQNCEFGLKSGIHCFWAAFRIPKHSLAEHLKCDKVGCVCECHLRSSLFQRACDCEVSILMLSGCMCGGY